MDARQLSQARTNTSAAALSTLAKRLQHLHQIAFLKSMSYLLENGEDR